MEVIVLAVCEIQGSLRHALSDFALSVPVLEENSCDLRGQTVVVFRYN